MTARDIGFITKQIAGHGRRDASAPAEWTAQMLAARSVDEDEFCEAVASRTRQNAAEVKYIFSVMDATLNVAGVISDASHVLITGEGLLVDGSAGDEGVWIVDADGNQVTEGRIMENDSASIECAFDEMPPAGSYRIEVRARNGAEKSFAPAMVRGA